jgi:anti-repressor protein
LRSRSILDRKNLPYQIFIDKGYFRTVETSYTKSDGTNCINIKTVVYQKGMEYIRNLIESAGR